MRIAHIGYAVYDIEKAKDEFERLGYIATTDCIEDNRRKVRILFMKNEEYCVELVAPLHNGSPVDNFLDKTGPAAYHVCYTVANIEQEIVELKRRRYILLEEPEEAVALQGCRVAFLMHRTVGLIELLEER